MLIDTHSHLFVEEFTEDLPLVMERAQKALHLPGTISISKTAL